MKPYLIVLSLLAVTSAVLHFMGETSMLESIGIAQKLPDSIGEYKGSDIRFCQNTACQRTELVTPGSIPLVCSACGGALDEWAVAEKALLPVDTTLIRKRYLNPAGEAVLVTVVISGIHRTSLHRPQMCLPGQGYRILREHTAKISMPDKAPASVRILDLQFVSTAAPPVAPPRLFAYAYWFTAPNRKTASHLTRTFYMAYDSVVHGVSRRWASIAIMTNRREGSSEHMKRIETFIGALYATTGTEE